jgi:hypothetical protein
MKKKTVLCVMIAAAILAALLLVGCGGNKKPDAGEKEADLPEWLNNFPPEDALWGIGWAQTESDGESILLAEDRARTPIARQLDTRVYDYTSEDQSVDVSQTITSKIVIGSSAIMRYKDKNGGWWCLVELPKANALLDGIELAQDGIAAPLRSNMENYPDVKNTVVLDDIPIWVFKPEPPEDMIWAVGAAKLDNDGGAVYLAMERARRSLARSISAEINAVYSAYSVNESLLYQEDDISVTSAYEYTPIQMLLLDQAKTKDGTFWVLVGYPKNQLR